MAQRTVLIAGATGVVGRAALEHFAQLPEWRVVSMSRRQPDGAQAHRTRHLSVDLTDPKACTDAIAAIGEITHVVYAALFEKPGLVKGWREPDQMQTNLTMLRNLLTPLTRTGHRLQHVSLLQGTKAYGVHLHPVAVPAREDQARDSHENFYWLQEDFLRELAQRDGFGFTIFRPQLIFGDALGVAMNLVPIIGAYAAIRHAQGKPFSYPGGPTNILEATDARLLARAMAWAAESANARNQTFNITNGDVFAWRTVWPAIADALGVECGSDEPVRLAHYLPEHAPVWDRIVTEHRLNAPALSQMLGESHHYADFCFGAHARQAPPPVIVSTIKLRQAGFADCIDTERMFRDWISILQSQRILPKGRAN
jgi:nucleoside-diphosphate-sugar epimerase